MFFPPTIIHLWLLEAGNPCPALSRHHLLLLLLPLFLLFLLLFLLLILILILLLPFAFAFAILLGGALTVILTLFPYFFHWWLAHTHKTHTHRQSHLLFITHSARRIESFYT